MFIFGIVVATLTLLGAIYGFTAERFFFRGLGKERRKELKIKTVPEIILANPFTFFLLCIGWCIAGLMFALAGFTGHFAWKHVKTPTQGATFIKANALYLTSDDVERLCLHYNMSAKQTVEVQADVAMKKMERE